MKNKFELEHIGINTQNEQEALELATVLSDIFNLPARQGQKSKFAGDYFECMNAPYLGKNGHVAMKTYDLESAMIELKEKGVSFNMATATYDYNNKMKNIYLDKEYGGFAIHILQA